MKSREIYKILIEEHRAMHREIRIAQLKNHHKFNVKDIVVVKVQVQSKKSIGQVKKLTYMKIGSYTIVSDLPSGSYELQLLGKPKSQIMKKHGSDIYLCPKEITLIKPWTHQIKCFLTLTRN